MGTFSILLFGGVKFKMVFFLQIMLYRYGEAPKHIFTPISNIKFHRFSSEIGILYSQKNNFLT